MSSTWKDIKAKIATYLGGRTERGVKGIGAKWTQRDGGCPMCGCDHWDAHGFVIITMSQSPNGEDFGDKPQGFPAAAMTCSNCAFVALLNLQRAGLLPR